MPTGPLHGARLIVDSTLATNPHRILDLGMGTGKYGFLLRDQGELGRAAADPLHLTGIEGWGPYITPIQQAVYDEIVVADVRDFLQKNTSRYDVALALDIIEHFPPDQSFQFLDLALNAADYVIVSTPRSFFEQEHAGNDLERHLSWWPEPQLRKAARNLGANIDTHRDRLTVYAILSRTQQPQLATEHRRERVVRIRTLLLPDRVYYPLRGKTGPSYF